MTKIENTNTLEKKKRIYKKKEKASVKLETNKNIEIFKEESITNKIKENVSSPISEPISKAIIFPVSENLSNPTVEHVLQSVNEPIIQQVIEPVLEPLSDPKPVSEHVLQSVHEQIIQQVIEPAPEPISEPISQTVSQTVSETVSESVSVHETIPVPVSEPAPELVSESAPEIVSEPAPELVSEQVSEPVFEPVPELVSELVSELAPEPISEPVSEPVSELVSEPVPEPISEPVSELVSELAPEPISEPVSELVSEPVSEPVPEPISEPVSEPAPEPVSEPAPEPISETVSEQESVPEPVSEPICEPVLEPEELSIPILEIVFENENQPAYENPEIVNQKVCEYIQDEINEKLSIINEISIEIEKESLVDHMLHENNIVQIMNIQEEIKRQEQIIKNEIHEDNKYTLNHRELLNILESNIIVKYTLDDLKKIFFSIDKALLLIQIINGEIKFIEKAGYESRNQSVIDLLIMANKYKKLPDVQFLVFTNDFFDNIQDAQYPYILTFCKNILYNTTLFPNFNFNHWLEANIGIYENFYNKMIENTVSWENKKNTVFWSGANTNIIRKKVYDGSIEHLLKNSNKEYNYIINLINKYDSNIKYYSIDEHTEYKYLINMNGYSFGGRLNYLFMTGSCIIILKNDNKKDSWEEFFNKYFIPGEDYIEIVYREDESNISIIEKINNAIENNNCKDIAERSFEKAQKIFKMNNIYEYIHSTLTELGETCSIENKLEKTALYSPENINYFFENRIKVNDNSFSFMFRGKEVEFLIRGETVDILYINIMESKTFIYFNNEIIYEKITPFLVNPIKNQQYDILIKNNELNIVVEKRFTLITCFVPMMNFKINAVDIKTEKYGGWWII